jgi:hypothetical protein
MNVMPVLPPASKQFLAMNVPPPVNVMPEIEAHSMTPVLPAPSVRVPGGVGLACIEMGLSGDPFQYRHVDAIV